MVGPSPAPQGHTQQLAPAGHEYDSLQPEWPLVYSQTVFTILLPLPSPLCSLPSHPHMPHPSPHSSLISPHPSPPHPSLPCPHLHSSLISSHLPPQMSLALVSMATCWQECSMEWSTLTRTFSTSSQHTGSSLSLPWQPLIAMDALQPQQPHYHDNHYSFLHCMNCSSFHSAKNQLQLTLVQLSPLFPLSLLSPFLYLLFPSPYLSVSSLFSPPSPPSPLISGTQETLLLIPSSIVIVTSMGRL